MAFLVNSPSLVTTGTTDADYFLVQNAGANGATIEGYAGNDTLEATGGGAASAGFYANLAGGADLVTASGIGATGVGTILGGAGADTITFSGITLLESVKLGDGSDQLNWASGFDYSELPCTQVAAPTKLVAVLLDLEMRSSAWVLVTTPFS